VKIQKIGILGAGTMGGGSGIAHLTAMKGFEVVLYCVEQRFVEGAIKRISGCLDRKIENRKMTVEEKEMILKRITITTKIEDFAQVDLVIETIFEDIETKQIAFEKLDKICGPNIIFGSNSSAALINALASVTSRPDKVVGLRFLNPALVMRRVEVIRGYYTSDETMRLASEVIQAMGKTTVMPFVKSIHNVEKGVHTPEDVDILVSLGLSCLIPPMQHLDYSVEDSSLHV